MIFVLYPLDEIVCEKTTYEATYTAPDASKDSNGQVLEINEKVSSNGEAMTLAKKRLREKNSQEFKASFNLAGDARLVAGVSSRLAKPLQKSYIRFPYLLPAVVKRVKI